MTDKPKRRPILCLDFDGVIHSYQSGWHGHNIAVDPPVPGALEFMAEASKYFELHVFSSRSNKIGGVGCMQRYILAHAEAIDKDSTWITDIKWPEHKPPAFITIDDRAIRFTGIWPDVKDLLDFQPWNKRTEPDTAPPTVEEITRRAQQAERVIDDLAVFQLPEEFESTFEDDADMSIAYQGLDREEWLEMAYENMINTARAAKEGRKP